MAFSVMVSAITGADFDTKSVYFFDKSNFNTRLLGNYTATHPRLYAPFPKHVCKRRVSINRH
jgi:hypothetical protein